MELFWAGCAVACTFAVCWLASRAAASTHAFDRSAAHQIFLDRQHFGSLDGLRALSVIAVVWSHVTPHHGLNLLNQGHKGVDLFFAISGFLVTTLLLREHRRYGAVSLRSFYIRRSLRIFPLYYVVLALYCVLVFLTQKGTPKAAEFWSNLPAFLTYTSNWFVALDEGGPGVTFYFAWSLATEEQFYLFWPPLMLACLAIAKRKWTPVLLALALLVVQILAAHATERTMVATVFSSISQAILFGVAFAVLLDHRPTFNFLAPAMQNRWMAPFAAAALLLSMQLDFSAVLSRFLMAVLVVSVCIRAETMLRPVLTLRPLVLVGTISYGVYLMHMLAANVVRKLIGHDMGVDVFVGTLAVVIPAAYVSFRYFESPLLGLKHRLGASRPSARITAPVTKAV